MQTILTITKTILSVILLLFFHFIIAFFLPNPVNTINIFFIYFVLFIIGWEKSIVIWIAFFIFYIFELYSVVPLGFIIVPGIISVMTIYLLYVNVFTNRSWFTSFIMVVIAISINRLLYLFLVYVLNYASGISSIVIKNFFIDLFWELVLTSVISSLLFYLLSKKYNRFSRDKVNMIL
ncbi:MAG: hypothetical protein A2725_00620 [Candidatus Magasanikbacteria bacterium RIFCSPHIGHO2_01_FULL_33_34]|uniref:Rod shape-determining protein MreD n=1 Tax=Candidatus Magasanikbacteria bacterium RIFCSPHIGHO2_01_FULL_33_34 TaxID=1798671 RepID=A0A1F6LL75_9BACT|nr:MAG: hypothetical protein A2725_00620 [Candidatus Magasanikbacteria bacterium RIFCSPHIGHO2_01_FULL_33_34]OGH65863.1 MAG: hypothetical protein A3B83_03290 [Candidatus Magasanikbacteria bacterium RIFCSPHIGHO2_02_FULL_33_17]OGH75228.1 MAG: hypothetical protein A3A89_03885 [Candidatus Magasanikbacteria bacterium RIFCSPLOWO2_01_FULL_33_34]OGH81863.1 MAG: hypothetical protein A3F93_01195 [Candidatus Magasanikbacteria bacterium RIFCSPLOWO2_12_FULL_34_7]